MFERYTDQARRAIFYARYNAAEFRLAAIELECLLLGLVRADQDSALRFFSTDEEIDKLKKSFEQRISGSHQVSVATDMPLSHESKRAMAYAAEEAERLLHRHIGIEHLYLGILREEESAVAAELRGRGITLERLRREAVSGALAAAPPGYHPGTLHRLVDSLPRDRQEAAGKILGALQDRQVNVKIVTESKNFEIRFPKRPE